MLFCHHHGDALIHACKRNEVGVCEHKGMAPGLWECPVPRCRVKVEIDYRG